MRMSNNAVNSLGKIIIVKLYEMNKTQIWLANQCKVTPTSISMIVNGKRNPSKKLLYGISKSLDIPYDVILSTQGVNGDK